MGFKARSTDRIISVKNCPILVPSLNDYLLNIPPASFKGRRLLLGTPGRVYSEEDKDIFKLSVGGREISLKASLFFQSNPFVLPDLLEFALQEMRGERGHGSLLRGWGFFLYF